MGFNNLTDEEIAKFFDLANRKEKTPEFKNLAKKILGIDEQSEKRIAAVLKSENLSDAEIKDKMQLINKMGWVLVTGSE